MDPVELSRAAESDTALGSSGGSLRRVGVPFAVAPPPFVSLNWLDGLMY